MNPGDKVVCIDGYQCFFCDYVAGVTTNSIYVIKETLKDPDRKTAIRLVGVCCHAFMGSRFRLLDEMKREADRNNSQK